MAAPDKIRELVERFAYNLDSYRSGDYKEARVRSEFIDPMFKALGWDISNEQGYAEAYKDVVSEDSLKVGGATKAPDYSFRIGGVRKFFLEAKKPSVNIKSDIAPAYQLRRYAWSAKLPLSVLTDFEELAVYDCRIQPKKNDKSSVARTMYFTYEDYLEKWDELASVFSREAILKGAFDKYAEANKKRRGTAEVDDAFLDEIETWRRVLASNIALNNHTLSQRELNAAVQKTIDRIIFLRITEDRGIEPYGALQDLTKGENVYRRLGMLFQKANDRYNSGLFHFNEERNRTGDPDTFTLQLTIDDEPLQNIIKSVYYPDSPYEFSVLPADILGQVYERFLGKVILLDREHQATIEDKPEVKKAGGVYYTPTYIVDYIVENTVGTLLAGKTPDQIAAGKTPPLRVLDPACGSGTFLLGAYQYLLDWHLAWYVSNDPQTHAKKKRPKIYQDQKGQWRLSTDERKHILLTHIYGVDIDAQAVEVTKLSLLLKVLEGENNESLNQQSQLFQERVLPDLSENIKCGNSLIAPDFYENVQPHLLGEEEHYRINVFDWQDEFADVFADGGFDAVIGNPPWGALFSSPEQEYLFSHYLAAQTRGRESYAIFVEKALNALRPEGLLGFIVPDTFLRKSDYLSIRRLFLERAQISELIETGPVFSEVRDTWCLVFNLANIPPSTDSIVTHKKISRFIVSAESRLAQFGRRDWDSETHVRQLTWQKRPNLIIGYLASEANQAIISKLENYPSLGVQAHFLVSRGEEGSKYNIKEDSKSEFFMVTPAQVERYQVQDGVRVDASTLTKGKLKTIYSHPKIWIIRIQKMRWKQRIVSALDTRDNSAGMKTLQSITSVDDSLEALAYLQAILASKLINFWCINFLADDMNKTYLESLPIPPLNDDKLDIGRLSLELSSYYKQLANAKTSQDKKMYTRLITQTDKQIDQKVYELYGLTDDEIAVIEQT